ncbi:MAG: energy-coupled thiamine transporter ThiT [Christensenellales bacterium]
MKFTSILKEPFNTLDTVSKLSVTAFYFAIVLVALVVIAAIFLKKAKPEKLQPFMKSVKYFVFGAATTFAVSILTLKISDDVQSGTFVKEVFWPIVSILIVAAVLLGTGFIISAVKPEFLQKYKYIAAGVLLIPVIVCIVMLALHFKDVGEEYDGTSQVGLYISAVVLVALLVLACTLLSKRKGGFTTREMAYAAIALALAFALSYVKLFESPQGGAITLASMLPLMLFSYMFGIRKGIIVGAIYGVLQAIQDPWIIHPAQFFLDYPIAFAMTGLAGIFKELNVIKKPVVAFTVGAILAGTLRYFSHVFSGIFAFASYALPGYSAVAYGFWYNALYLPADVAIVIVVALLLFSSKSFVRLVNEKSTEESADEIESGDTSDENADGKAA